MSNQIIQIPQATNEPVLSYAPGSKEKRELKLKLAELKSKTVEICMTIGGQKVKTENRKSIHPPHELAHTLGYFYKGNQTHVQMAIQAALDAKESWENMPWQDRAAIFLKAADLIAGKYRAQTNAMTMLGQSKNIFQSEIDAVCEFCDFLRFNVQFLTEIYAVQPQSAPLIWNKMEYRPLEGFVFALTPFNFTSIAGNLPCAPALMGNTIVWKPAETQIYSASLIMEILEEAGLPAGVINLIFVDGSVAGSEIFKHKDFAGIHFTGSTKVFQSIWKTVGENLPLYKSFPRMVGETGGKDFVLAHSSANAKAVAVALSRGAFEFQGQKCSAASRAYIPESLWPDVRRELLSDLSEMKMGSPENFTNFINAVIDEKSFDKLKSYIDQVAQSGDAEIIAGGKCDKSVGYFIEPTVILTRNPQYVTMCEELFGPVLSVYVYADSDYDAVLKLVDTTSEYALTGAVFAQDRNVIIRSSHALRNSAGNFYINDKPTGAVVAQQPFGGARASGTNDKAGSVLNLYRWVSPRTIKENFATPLDFKYPFMAEE
ncbi:MAG TPA: L-glutamate gamma-semialdehyde dehydrogenase [Saprospiraceae bacterium]|nr:L-glutamate gamma-semialdehyde dehydrogenase [Saprospiraceae bacterium]